MAEEPTSAADDSTTTERRSSRFGAGSGIAVLLGVLAFVFLFGWVGLRPNITVPVLVGAFLGLLATDLVDSLVTGGIAGLCGSAIAAVVYHAHLFGAYLARISPAAKIDIGPYFQKGFVLPLIAANPVNHSRFGPVGVILTATVLTVVVSAGVWWVVSRLSLRDSRWPGLVLIAALGVCLSWTLFAHSTSFVQTIRVNPAPKSYAFDPIINLKTYYLMRGGMNYYDAIITAASGDKRINDVRNLKWGRDWTIVSPTRVRQPLVFYFWALVGHFDATGILWASILLAIGVWVAWYWALFALLGQRALFVAFALFPLCVVHMAWFNLFHPDWWASLMLMYSAAFLVAKRFKTSAVFALLAAMCREVVVFYLLVVLAVGAVRWLLKRESVRAVVPFAVALAVFVVAFGAHYLAEAPYIVLKSGGSTLAEIIQVSTRPLSSKLFGPTSYLMLPYGDGVVPGFVVDVIGTLGLFFVLRRSGYARWALAGYLVFFLGFMAILGASSTYWGQDISALGVVGCAVLVAGLDRLGVREETA
jgi:hypothetical protein